MIYDDVIGHVVDGVEGVGVAIMVGGAAGAFVLFARQVRRGADRAYHQLRENVGRVILLGLEVLIIADIIRTIVVEPTFESVAVLGAIVVIRIVLSFSLEVEIDGAWPWRRAGEQRADGSQQVGGGRTRDAAAPAGSTRPGG